ncbi:hypothetical protein ACTXT7_010256 [Hymenolepis weldensis]
MESVLTKGVIESIQAISGDFGIMKQQSTSKEIYHIVEYLHFDGPFVSVFSSHIELPR